MSSENENKKPSSLLSQWKLKKKTAPKLLTPKPNDAVLLPSKGQKRLWLLQSLHPENTFYQYAHRYDIKGQLDASIFDECLTRFAQTQEVLNTNFVADEDGVKIKVSKPTPFKSRFVDLRSNLITRDEELHQQIQKESNTLFDLENDRLLRSLVIQISDNQFIITLSIHHIIGDRWSLQLLNKEVFGNYQRLVNGDQLSEKEPSYRYSDYAYWQNQKPTSQEDLDYWKSKLAGEIALLDMPTDYSRPARPTFRGGNEQLKLSNQLAEQLKKIANEQGVTMYVLMLTAYKIFLHRYTNQEDIIVGSPFSNRDHKELEHLFGFFNETLVLRSNIDENKTFQDTLSDVKLTYLEAFKHRNVPFEEVVKAIDIQRHGSANPIFQSMFLYNNPSPFQFAVESLEVEEKIINLGVSKFDLTLFVNDVSNNISLDMEYSLDLYNQDTIKRLLQNFVVLLQEIADHSDQKISEYEIITKAESNKILKEWNDTGQIVDDTQNVHKLIEKCAIETPTNVALTYKSENITYQELNNAANLLSSSLIRKNVSKGDIIGLYVDRSIDFGVGMLSVLKSGAAYLPLDPLYPKERIEYMVQDSHTKTILCQSSNIDNLRHLDVGLICIDEQDKYQTLLPSPSVSNDDIAYIIYTSGSTGNPKGVPITHGNLLYSTMARFQYYPHRPTAFLLLSSFSFDSSVAGIFWTLCSGGNLIISPVRIEQDVTELAETIHHNRVSHTLMLPSLYKAILNDAPLDKLSSLKNVMVAGEACPLSLVEKHYTSLPDVSLYNEYGPTEATVWCVAHKIRKHEEATVPIGKPIPNARAYIMNSSARLCPIGVAGELVIGGKGVAKAYLNNDHVSASKFIAHPYSKGERLYRTGDLARQQSNGIIEFLGRVDNQVKIRGYRVEPEEIQNKLKSLQDVDDVAVVVQQQANNSRKSLIAYVSGLEQAEAQLLTEKLKKILPDYMIPSKIIALEDFIRLPNGKIDRNNLPKPDQYDKLNQATYTAPSSDAEITLATIWQQVLGIDNIGIHDNFFSLGGDSILSIQIVSKVRDKGIILPPNELFEKQTIYELAQSVEDLTQSIHNEELITTKKLESYALSNLQRAFLFNHQSGGEDSGLLQLEFTISGDLNADTFIKSWHHVTRIHGALRSYIVLQENHKPIQATAIDISNDIKVLDWRNKPKQEQSELLAALRITEKNDGLNLYQAPVSNISLIQLSENENLIFWTCHHIFLDGWSCGIILKDALAIYHKLLENKIIDTKSEAENKFLSYLHWQSDRNQQKELQFWKNELKDFHSPQLFDKIQNNDSKFEDAFLRLSKSESDALEQFAKRNHVTLSTLLQGLWSISLGKVFNTDDVVYGVTVSGRFSNFPEVERTAGLFMNIIPNRIKIRKDDSIKNWLTEIHKNQGELRKYENTPLESIKNAIEWPIHRELFDSLFVYGNFLKDGFKVGQLSIDHFEGGFSSGYPLTIRVNPLEAIEFDWRYDTSFISSQEIEKIKGAFYHAINWIININDTPTVSQLQNIFSDSLIIERKKNTAGTEQKTYQDPKSDTEKKIAAIWSKLFDLPKVSMNDDFFALGGKSLVALQLFSEIEYELDTVLSPSILFERSTIAELAKVIDGSDSSISDDHEQLLVALRSSGSRTPLFCIHGGGAHVLFYKDFASHLHADQPIYSFQPPGISDTQTYPKSISELAALYITKMKTIQPQGPYQILATCFSNAVAVEMSFQLRSIGETIDKLFIIDSAPLHLFGNDESVSGKTVGRFLDMLKRGDYSMIKRKIAGRFTTKKEIEPLVVEKESQTEKKLRVTIQNLNKMYSEYTWKDVYDPIYFIRSGEFQNRTDKSFHVKQWRKMAKGGLSLYIVDGHHTTLFEDPEAKGLAKKVTECLEKTDI